MNKTVNFTEKDVKEFLDTIIKYWRKRKEEGEQNEDQGEVNMCMCYIDAYQSVRISLFGELLPK